ASSGGASVRDAGARSGPPGGTTSSQGGGSISGGGSGWDSRDGRAAGRGSSGAGSLAAGGGVAAGARPFRSDAPKRGACSVEGADGARLLTFFTGTGAVPALSMPWD